MSTWTHVVGNIRVDGIPASGVGMSIQDIEQALGPMCTYEEWNESSSLPRGSEGSLQYQIIEYGSGLRWLTIPIWGDLRDFEDGDVCDIQTWWNDLIPKLGRIRDAVLHIRVEGSEPIILQYRP